MDRRQLLRPRRHRVGPRAEYYRLVDVEPQIHFLHPGALGYDPYTEGPSQAIRDLDGDELASLGAWWFSFELTDPTHLRFPLTSDAHCDRPGLGYTTAYAADATAPVLVSAGDGATVFSWAEDLVVGDRRNWPHRFGVDNYRRLLEFAAASCPGQ